MKKLLSLLLCAVMVICAVLPCFAAGGTLTTSGDSTPFEQGWNVVTKNFGDYADQPELLNNAEYWATHGSPDYSQPGFSGAGSAYITLWGGNEMYPIEEVWAGAPTFQVPFEVPADGEYSFAFLLCSSGEGKTAGKKVPVRIDDGETYQLVLDGIYTVSAGKPTPAAYYGMNNISLTAGEHIFHFTRPLDVSETQYYFGFKYTGEALGSKTPDVPVEPEINYNLSYVTNLPQAFSGATYVAAKDTIAELNADLPYTIYGEPTYPVGDLFNGAVALGDGSKSYQFKINVPKDGDYSFAFLLSSGGNKGRGLAAITIDGEGTPYTALSDGKLGWKQHEYYTGMKVTLTKGEHIVCIQGANSNPYFHGFYYYRDIGDPFANPAELTATPSAAFAKPKYPIYSFKFWDADIVAANEANGLVNSASGASSFDFGVTLEANGGWANVVTMHPAAKAPYTVDFTVKTPGLYEFRFDFISDNNGRGAYLQVDNEVAFHVNLKDVWPKAISAYGMQVELEAGTHTFKLYANVGGGCAYSQGFAVTLVQAYATEGEAAAGEIMAAPMNPIPGTGAAPVVPGENWDQPLQNLINPLPDTDASDNDPADGAIAPPQPNGSVMAPPAPGAGGNTTWLPALPKVSMGW